MEEEQDVLRRDVQALAEPVLSHRLVMAPEYPRAAAREVIADAVSSVRAL